MTLTNHGFVKFAVVGLGNIGPRHLAVLDAQPCAKIAAVCDIDQGKCDKYSTLYNQVPVFNNYSEMLQNVDADVVSICTPHHLHAPMAIEAMEAGKHVLVEKPMSLTSQDAQSMISVARSLGRRLMIVKQNRYNVPIVLTQKSLAENRLGRIFMVQCNVLWNRHQGYYADSNWRGKKALEGGALYTQVSHFIDLMIWWFGDVMSAQAEIATKNHATEIEDCGTASVEFSSGVMGSITWTTCVHARNYEGSITIIGERGTVKIGGQYLNTIEYWDVQDYPLPKDIAFVDQPNAYGKYQGTSSNHDKVMRDVVEDILHAQQNVVQGDEGLKSVQAIEMIYRNARMI